MNCVWYYELCSQHCAACRAAVPIGLEARHCASLSEGDDALEQSPLRAAAG